MLAKILKMDSLQLFYIFVFFLLFSTFSWVEPAPARKDKGGDKNGGGGELECKDGNLMGLDELKKSIDKSVEECKNVTTSKNDLLKCIFDRIKVFGDDGVPVTEKIKGFFQKLFSSKIMTETKNLMGQFKDCAETYAKSFKNTKSTDDLGKAAEQFGSCFSSAVDKFTTEVKKECPGSSDNNNKKGPETGEGTTVEAVTQSGNDSSDSTGSSMITEATTGSS